MIHTLIVMLQGILTTSGLHCVNPIAYLQIMLITWTAQCFAFHNFKNLPHILCVRVFRLNYALGIVSSILMLSCCTVSDWGRVATHVGIPVGIVLLAMTALALITRDVRRNGIVPQPQ